MAVRDLAMKHEVNGADLRRSTVAFVFSDVWAGVVEYVAWLARRRDASGRSNDEKTSRRRERSRSRPRSRSKSRKPYS